MNAREIEILIQKYWDCETSRDEEILLQNFFLQEDIPEELKQYQGLFTYKKEQSELSLDESFDEKILSLIAEEPQQTGYRKKTLFSQITRIAAVALICLTIGSVATYFLTQDDEVVYTDTYDTPQEAYSVIQTAVFAVSNNLREGKYGTVEAMSKLNDFNEYFAPVKKGNRK